MEIGIYSLFSDKDNQESINQSLQPFIESVEKYLGESLVDINPADIKKGDFLPVIMIKSGGVEEKFKRIYQQFPHPYLLLAGCFYDALSAALEIKEYLKKRGEQVEILHGSEKYIAGRLRLLKESFEAKKSCRHFRAGVLGEPSTRLIGSGADYNIIRKKSGIRIYNIPIEEMVRHIDLVKDEDVSGDMDIQPAGFKKETVQQERRIYQGLKNLSREYNFNAITVSCSDLRDFYKNTGYLALSLLNSEGIIAGCDGDVPALISMIIANQLTKQPVFLASPSCIKQETNEIIFANCFIPINMCESYEWKTHFELETGIAICGKIKKGPVTLFKINGNMDNYYLAEGELTDNLELPTLCPTQVKITLKEPVADFLEKSISSHYIICRGLHLEKFEKYLSLIR